MSAGAKRPRKRRAPVPRAGGFEPRLQGTVQKIEVIGPTAGEGAAETGAGPRPTSNPRPEEWRDRFEQARWGEFKEEVRGYVIRETSESKTSLLKWAVGIVLAAVVSILIAHFSTLSSLREQIDSWFRERLAPLERRVSDVETRFPSNRGPADSTNQVPK